MSEKKTEGIAQKKVSRRSMLKWTGALAAAAVVGAAVEYGATYKPPTPPPPPPPSLKPPLSPEIQARVDQITKNLVDRHAGETIMYGGCSCNCAGTGCIFKWHLKNGVITAIEPDDTHHPNVGMEDKVMTQKEFDWALFNRRGCPIGHSWLDHLYSPDRVLYPIKRAPGTPRGGGKWVRIPWDEAINTIATTMKQLKDKYGPFFLLNPYGSTTAGADLTFAAFGAGCMGYGLCSDDASRLMGPFTGMTSHAFTAPPGVDLPDGLKYSKVMILFGRVHGSTHWGGSGFAAVWYKRLAREKGIPIIYLDPKYTWDAEVNSDQYIPVKPGTDNALMMAMSYVILTEGLYDKAWADKYMYGWQQQADYILGNGGKGVTGYDYGDYGREANKFFTLDGFPDNPNVEYSKVPKTPEWAEKICAVPAETIRELARFYAKNKPGRIVRHAGITRKSYGEQTLKTFLFLSVLTGNSPNVHGGSEGTGRMHNRSASISTGSLPRERPRATPENPSAVTYAAPTFYRAFHWWKAVNYALRVKRGESSILWKDKKMTWDEWATLVGYNAYPEFKSMFDPKMLWGNASDCITMGENTNQQMKAMLDPAIEFSFHQHTRITSTGKYTDMILPLVDYTFENTAFSAAGYGSFDGVQFQSAPSKRAGEAKQYDQTCCEILEKIGGLDMAHLYWSGYNGAATFEQDYEKELRSGWEKNGQAWLKTKGVAAPPTWDELKIANKGHGLVQWHPSEFYPDIDTYCGQYELLSKTAFDPSKGRYYDTKTGKGEIYTDALADPATRSKEHFDYKGRKYAHMPNDWKDLQPISTYHPAFRGMEDFPAGSLKLYPLVLLTSKSRYAIHYLMGDPGNLRIRYAHRHSLIISPADAKARGIKDHDAVRVYNQYGQVAVRAYVTNRIMPGVVQLRTGQGPNYGFVTEGSTGERLDVNLGPETLMGGATNQFTGADDLSPVSPAKVTSSVQVEKMIAGPVY